MFFWKVMPVLEIRPSVRHTPSCNHTFWLPNHSTFSHPPTLKFDCVKKGSFQGRGSH